MTHVVYLLLKWLIYSSWWICILYWSLSNSSSWAKLAFLWKAERENANIYSVHVEHLLHTGCMNACTGTQLGQTFIRLLDARIQRWNIKLWVGRFWATLYLSQLFMWLSLVTVTCSVWEVLRDMCSAGNELSVSVTCRNFDTYTKERTERHKRSSFLLLSFARRLLSLMHLTFLVIFSVSRKDGTRKHHRCGWIETINNIFTDDVAPRLRNVGLNIPF